VDFVFPEMERGLRVILPEEVAKVSVKRLEGRVLRWLIFIGAKFCRQERYKE
jgi:hypothetical protein